MKTFLFTIITVFVSLIINAQESFFPTKEGMVLTYKSFDKKDKISGMMRYTIEKVNISTLIAG